MYISEELWRPYLYSTPVEFFILQLQYNSSKVIFDFQTEAYGTFINIGDKNNGASYQIKNFHFIKIFSTYNIIN